MLRGKADGNRFMGTLFLVQYRLNNAIHRRLEERSNVSPKTIILAICDIIVDYTKSPHELQLAKANVINLIVIPSRPKLDILWFFSFSEA